jgi:hypothetical protein
MFGKIIRGALASIVLAGLGLSAYAQAVMAEVPRVVFPRSTVGNITTFGPATADAANAKNFSFGAAANGSIFASGSGSIPTAGGSSIPITVGGTIPKATAAAAIGRFLRRGIPLISTAAALYELADDLGFGLDPATQTATIDTGAVQGFDGYKYGHDTTKPQNYKYTKQLACDYMATLIGTSMIVVPASGGSGFGCMRSTNTGTVYTLYRLASAPPASNYTPATPEQIADLIAANSNWPDSTALALAGTVKYAIQAGESLGITPDAVAGPATSPGPTTVTNNATNNTTTTNTEVHQHTYAGNTISTSIVRTSVTVDNSTNTVINETTSTEEPTQPEAFEFPCGVPGTAACDVKVDESGTPDDGSTRFDGSGTDLDAAKDSLLTKILDLEDWTPGNWTWTFQLPTGCTPLVMYLDVVIDPCQWQDQFHSIMAVIWVLTGIAGMFVIFSKAD